MSPKPAARTIHKEDTFIISAPVSGVGETVGQSLTLLLGDRFPPSRLDSARVNVRVEDGIDEAALLGIRVAPAVAVGDERAPIRFQVAVIIGHQPDVRWLGDEDTAIEDLDLKRVNCDVRDRRAVRRALRGVERVFHCAGVTSVRPQDSERVFDVNLRGTKLLMEECLRAEVERVVYTSSAAAVGPAAYGKTADETQLFTAGRLGIP